MTSLHNLSIFRISSEHSSLWYFYLVIIPTIQQLRKFFKHFHHHLLLRSVPIVNLTGDIIWQNSTAFTKYFLKFIHMPPHLSITNSACEWEAMTPCNDEWCKILTRPLTLSLDCVFHRNVCFLSHSSSLCLAHCENQADQPAPIPCLYS